MHDLLNRIGYSAPVRRLVTCSPAWDGLVSRFVAGGTVADAVGTAAALAAGGRLSTLNHRGTPVRTGAEAEHELATALELADALRADGLAAVSELSVKLEQLGLHAPGGERLARRNLARLCAESAARGLAVTVDMEGQDEVDVTLATVDHVRADHPDVGVAVQAYLRRTEADCRRLARPGTRVRLCKGGYGARRGAFTGPAVLDSYARCWRVLTHGGAYPMLATHDPRLIALAPAPDAPAGGATAAYEHQMLLGIRPDEQLRLAAAGAPVRVYVPYGPEWYAWFVHRIAERPANLRLLAAATVQERVRRRNRLSSGGR